MIPVDYANVIVDVASAIVPGDTENCSLSPGTERSW